MSEYHVPVLLQESVDALALKDGGIYVDATLGGGGHTAHILKQNPNIQLYSFDQDPESWQQTKDLEQKFSNNLTIVHDNFANLRTCLALERVRYIDGILFDLGVSSHQINKPERGFSFSLEGRLDMRMDKASDLTAYDIVNNFDVAKMRKIFWEYGEDRAAAKIARTIEIERANREITTTLQLAEIIDKCIPAKQRIKSKARIFQALRIYINGEIEVLKTALSDAVKMLNSGGRIVVISYHSLEDRVAKRFFKEEEKDCVCPSSFLKCVCDKQATLKILTRKPEVPSETEISGNNRARSAKMRIAEKLEVI